MSTKRVLLTILATSAVLVALSLGDQQAGQGVYAQSPFQANSSGVNPKHSQEVTIPYSGRLTDARGQPVSDEAYDFTFSLYDAETGGAPLWFETQTGVAVQNGMFNARLGSAQAIPSTALDRSSLWLEVTVRGPDEAAFTVLTPRQRMTDAAPMASDSPSAPPSCPHNHFGEQWQGNGVGLAVQSQDWIGLAGLAPGVLLPPAPIGKIGVYGYGEDTGVFGDGNTGVRGTSSTGYGVWGSSEYAGVLGTSDDSYGVQGKSTNGAGVFGQSTNNYGMFGEGSDGGVRGTGDLCGVYGESTSGPGIKGHSVYSHGVFGETAGDWGNRSGVYGTASQAHAHGVTGWNTGAGKGVYGFSTSGYGVYGDSDSGWAGYFSGRVIVFGGSNTGLYSESQNILGVAGVYGKNISTATGEAYGVKGETLSSSSNAAGVYGVANYGDAYGVKGGTLSSGSNAAGVYGFSNYGSAIGVYGKTTSSNGWAGVFETSVGNGVKINAPTGKTGLIVSGGGSKSAAVHTDRGERLLYSEESTQVWFSDYGFGTLQDSVAVIKIDPLFAQTVNLQEPYHVFLQVYGNAELYVTDRTATQFQVHLRDGDPNVEFSYRIVAIRLGYEEDRLEPAPWEDQDGNLHPKK